MQVIVLMDMSASPNIADMTMTITTDDQVSITVDKTVRVATESKTRTHTKPALGIPMSQRRDIDIVTEAPTL